MTTQQFLDERYGRRTSRRLTRVWWIVVGAVAVVATVALGWSTVATSLAAIDVDATGYAVVDDRTVTVTFQIVAPTDSTVACALEAQDEEHGVVGWRVVELPLEGGQMRAFTETIPTLAPATTGLVNSCWVA
ncbi:DUF4307 domain-containing protein [Microbacterium sp. zg.Y1090]|uniref:DUF4307 domain-containing protein n=1 Tax=Microbacterium TaxID=33882 RepID=UPI00214C09AA|nr:MULTISPECIES: DUF4307 domain-containing protein [unclassified Microbacterium]MCR2812165.1 DUF4307 domain-containing protein [Microbacterium sp. zg.Y1084]MCR2818397.1 DUF4307 domain-containing protein [Microbacterium sp. zg.Y1090]MDL5486210.1 DUF4307 domain-containing protein [Microbacterium sp. zg-Y1211]WIM29411.1 DUF4307 domain-containing protein [Microbacterium sp. zg-Y1090]